MAERMPTGLPDWNTVSVAEVRKLEEENKKVLRALTEKLGLAGPKVLTDISECGMWTLQQRNLVMVCVQFMARQLYVENWKQWARRRKN